jgi:hypothetical protein
MSTVAVNEITDEVGTGSPAFTNGLAQSDIAGALNATGTAPIYACRAWVNFDGTTTTIRDSGNVSSVTSLFSGAYEINFVTAMPDANYVPVSAGQSGVGFSGAPVFANNPANNNTTTSAQVYSSSAFTDDVEAIPDVFFAVFR